MTFNESFIRKVAEHADFYFAPDTAIFNMVAERIAEDYSIGADVVKSILLIGASGVSGSFKPRDYLGCFAVAYTTEHRITRGGA